MKIESRYKAQKGSYLSVVPDAASYEYLVSFLVEAAPALPGGRLSVPADLHCTVMFAPDSVLNAEQQFAVMRACTSFRAVARQLTCWQGGDGDSYIVLELDCPELKEFHAWLRSDFGMTPSFDDYRPHITLVSSLPACPPGSYPVKPVEIILSGLRIEDIK